MKTTDYVSTERVVTTCDVCLEGDSTARRMYVCLGCQKDICSACVKFASMYGDYYDIATYLCPACHPSFITANKIADDLVSAANEKAEKIIDAWKERMRSPTKKSDAVRFSFDENSLAPLSDATLEDCHVIVSPVRIIVPKLD